MNYSIGITTYSGRFEELCNLITSIKSKRQDSRIILAINGDINKEFNEEYRENILHLCNYFSKIFPIFFSEFRCLSKLWNSILIHSPENLVFLTQDDVEIRDSLFFNELESNIERFEEKSFKINSSWSHVLLNKKEVEEVNWFDERLLALGEEDGDFEWRYVSRYGGEFFRNTSSPYINHYGDTSTITEEEKKIRGRDNNTFNRNFLLNEKYKESEQGKRKGIINKKLILKKPSLKIYPYEKFHKDNRYKII